MAMSNAEKQKAWRERRDEELRNLRVRVFELERQLHNLKEGDKCRKRATDTTERRETAYHEAGHAVVGLAGQLPIAYVCSVPQGRSQVGHVAMVHRCNSAIGRAAFCSPLLPRAQWAASRRFADA
jgi:hypothetical protein